MENITLEQQKFARAVDNDESRRHNKSKRDERPTTEEFNQFREKYNLTYRDVADICGIRTNSVRDMAKGRSTVPIPIWRLLKIKIEGV